MSLILDALNKAQREREEQREPVPHLATVHYTPPPVSAETSPVLGRKRFFVGAGAFCVAAFAGGLWFAGGGSSTATPEPRPQTVAPIARETPTPAPAGPAVAPPEATPPREPAAPQEHAASGRAPAQEAVVGLYQTARTQADTGYAGSSVAADRASTAPMSPGVSPGVSPGESVRQSVSLPPSPTTVSQPGDRAAPPVQASERPTAKPAAEPVEPTPVAGPVDSLAARRDLSSLQELSWSMQQSLPSIMYSEHHYANEAAARRVVINGETHRAGSQLGQGLVLEEILSDGVVLRYQSQRFKLEALNSWVNF